MKRVAVLFILLFSVAWCATAAQTQPAKSAATKAATKPVATKPAAKLTPNESLLDLVKRKMPEPVILQTIKNTIDSGLKYDASPAFLAALQDAGGSDKVLMAVMGVESTSGSALSTSEPAPAAPAARPAAASSTSATSRAETPFVPKLTRDSLSMAVGQGLAMKGLDQAGLMVKTPFVERLVKDHTDVWGDHFGVSVYTPWEWVKFQAFDAKSLHKPFTGDSVTPKMIEPVLRVFIRQADTVKTVLIRALGEGVVEPVSTQACTRSMPFNGRVFGGSDLDPDCREYQFNLADVEGVRSVDGGFRITVQVEAFVGNRNGVRKVVERDFEVKKKDLAHLQ